MRGDGDDGLVCKCMTVPRGVLRAAFLAGDGSLEEVVARTGACGGCGTCRPQIRRLVRQWRLERGVMARLPGWARRRL